METRKAAIARGSCTKGLPGAAGEETTIQWPSNNFLLQRTRRDPFTLRFRIASGLCVQGEENFPELQLSLTIGGALNFLFYSFVEKHWS